MSLIYLLQTTSVIGMTFCGYHYHPQIRKFINNDSVKSIKDNFFNFSNNTYITEEVFCKIVGALTGTMVGRLFYPFGIPYTLYFVDKNYGEIIKKYIMKK